MKRNPSDMKAAMEGRAGVQPDPGVPREDLSLINAQRGAGGTPALRSGARDRPGLSRPILSIGLLVLGLLLGGCSTFNRDWKAAAAATTPGDDVQGRWLGRWLSDVN